MRYLIILLLAITVVLNIGCKAQPSNSSSVEYKWQQFVMGADLSYVNQIEDAGGVYKKNNQVADVYNIFKKEGCNTVRIRLWNNPSWQLPLTGGKLYANLQDAAKSIARAKALGMAVNLDLHYSDDWADPNKQEIPAAWKNLSLPVMQDSVYQFTLQVLQYLASRNLVPEMIQVGNETTNGMLWPLGKIQNDTGWVTFGALLNSGIKAVRDFSKTSTTKPQIILHVAQIQYTGWWTQNLLAKAGVTDFDILGISHYYKWSTVNHMTAIGDSLRSFKQRFGKKVMIVETAFPWTNSNNDSYNNIFYSTGDTVAGFSITQQGQQEYLRQLTQQIINAKCDGIMYWEPAWITSPLKDRWGTGSSWENAAFFDFNGNFIEGINFMKYPYKFPQ